MEVCFTHWRPVTSGMPQIGVGSFFVCHIYIDDLDDNICGVVNKFAGDAKIDGVVVSEEGYLRLQWDMNQQEEWAREWQMEFNLDWCEVMHFEKLSNGRI